MSSTPLSKSRAGLLGAGLLECVDVRRDLVCRDGVDFVGEDADVLAWLLNGVEEDVERGRRDMVATIQ